jgi:hypothetical protein
MSPNLNRYQYAILVQWPHKTECLDLGEDEHGVRPEVHLSPEVSEVVDGPFSATYVWPKEGDTPVPAIDHGRTIANVILHGSVKPTWMLVRYTGQLREPGSVSMHPITGAGHDVDRLLAMTRPQGKVDPVAKAVVSFGGWAADRDDDDDDRTDLEAGRLVSIMDLVSSDLVTDVDGQRIHALADLITALQSLEGLVGQMGASKAWTEPGLMRGLVAKAQDCLQVILGNGVYLTEDSKADQVDLAVCEAELRDIARRAN